MAFLFVWPYMDIIIGEKMNENLVYIGKIISLDPIPDADNILLATVICGAGGKWKGVVRKKDFKTDDLCIVFLPDSLVPQIEAFRFLEKSGWRVRMQRFRGAPSEVLISPITWDSSLPVGTDITQFMNVKKYIKPVPPNLQGKVIGEFPGFIPKTDEPNWQSVPELVQKLHGHPYYVSLKYDGSSTTAYKRYNHFGVCSRNWELGKDESNGYWKVAKKYDLENTLPDGIALQWETCGPKVQDNPLELPELDGFAFSAYNIYQKRYLDGIEFTRLVLDLKFPRAKLLTTVQNFDSAMDLQSLAKVKYPNDVEAEGVVVRSILNFDHKPISFKVINLDYKN